MKEDFFRKRIPKYGGVGEGIHVPTWFVLFVSNKCSFWVLLNRGFGIYWRCKLGWLNCSLTYVSMSYSNWKSQALECEHAYKNAFCTHTIYLVMPFTQNLQSFIWPVHLQQCHSYLEGGAEWCLVFSQPPCCPKNIFKPASLLGQLLISPWNFSLMTFHMCFDFFSNKHAPTVYFSTLCWSSSKITTMRPICWTGHT